MSIAFFLNSYVWQETFAAQIIDSNDDFVLPTAAGVEGAWGRVGKKQGSGEWAGTKSRKCMLESMLDDDEGGPGEGQQRSGRSATQQEVRLGGGV